MRRPIWLRALIGLWGVWFSAALMEAPGLHVCPVHEGHARHSVDSHATHEGRHAIAGTAGGSAQSTAPDRPHHGLAECTCLGLCCGTAPVAAPAPSLDLLGVAGAAEQASIRATVATPIVRRDRAQPFANGPPLA